MSLDPIGARNGSVLLGFLSTDPMTPMTGLILIYACGRVTCTAPQDACLLILQLILLPVRLSRVIGVIGFRAENTSRTEPFRAPMGSRLIGGAIGPIGVLGPIGDLIVDRLDVLLGGRPRFIIRRSKAPVQLLRQASDGPQQRLPDSQLQDGSAASFASAARAYPARQTCQSADENIGLLVAHGWSEWGWARNLKRG